MASKILRKTLGLALGLWAGAAQAQDTGYGCHGILTARGLEVIEGTDGQFFPVSPDLMNLNVEPPESVARLARFARTLEAAGTRLIYVPMPTKALAAPQYLPPLAGYLGFDTDLAATVHGEMQKALREAGVSVVDARRALRVAGQAEPVFFGPDPRPNSAGQKALAEAVAQRIAQTPGFGRLPKTRFVMLEGAEQDLPSALRVRLQRHCQADLPPVRARVSMASVAPGAPQPSDEGRVMVVSSDMTGAPGLGFAGYLQEALGLAVEATYVPGGNAFDAMSALVTSRAFAQNPPAYLVWENPVGQSLGQFGEQPMAELTAAVGPTCTIPLATTRGAGEKRLEADLSPLFPGLAYTVMLDTDSLSATQAAFHTPVAPGLMRTQSIYRHKEAPATGRFFMPLFAETHTTLEIEIDVPFGPQPRLMACALEVTQ